MKRIMAFFLTVVMMFSVSTATFSEDKSDLNISLNGEAMSFSMGKPYVKDGNTMVPIREVAEKMGLTVTWESPKIILQNSQYDVEFMYDSTKVSVNGAEKQSPASIDIKDGISYAPLRFICENIGATVGYDAAKSAVSISSAEPKDELGFSENLNAQMPTDQNYMFSPLSIKMAMAMAANGAKGTTQKEILDATGIADLNKYNESTSQLIKKYKDNDSIKLNIANSIWLNRDSYNDVDFSSTYRTTIQNYFDGEIQKVDAKSAVNTINNWVSQKTNQKITKIINDNDFSAALINATYFKGKWESPFEKSDTKKDTFTDRKNETSQIDFMNQTDYFDYCDSDGVQMVRLPYKDSKISMYIALSDDRTINFEKNIAEMTYTRVALHIPKFQTEYSTRLNDILGNLGIKTAFDKKNADFKPMFANIPDTVNVYIDKVLHKNYIDVNEEGTEAAAVTGGMMGPGCAPPPEEPVAFNADKPFTYFIRDDESGEILFMGEYAFAK